MLHSADWAYAPRGTAIERRIPGSAIRGRIMGGALLATIYGIVLYASVGLFRTPSTETYATAYRLIGFLNIVILPLPVLAAVVGVRRISRDGMRNGHLTRLLIAPCWLSLLLSLLTVPIGMGQANAAQHGADAGLRVAPTFLLAPWGFMLAYGLSLFIIYAMFGFPFPARTEASSQPNTAGLR
jgi:hypothetical protein